jgi:small-conductance mechanosensitive channel
MIAKSTAPTVMKPAQKRKYPVRVANATLRVTRLVMKEPPPMVLLQDFAENALLFKLYFWVTLDGKAQPELVESDLRLMIGKRFAEAGIQFPFPQRDVHLKFDPDTRLNISKPPPAERPS